MSLLDESFPDDELFDMLNDTEASQNQRFHRQFSICQNLDEPDNFEHHESPFLNSDCSEKTCASDPVGLEHEDDKHANSNECEDEDLNAHTSSTNMQLGSKRSSKAVSYQDIHSQYTKRRYKHVTSKVAKYISDIQDQEKQRRNGSSTFQRHRSMPESLTPRGSAEDQQKLDESLSLVNSSITDTHTRDECERLQSYAEFLEDRLNKKSNDYIQVKRNFEAIRNDYEAIRAELNNEKQKRQTGLPSESISAYSIYCPALSFNKCVAKATQTDLPSNKCVAKTTQTDLPPPTRNTVHLSHLSDLSDMPGIAANATPNPNYNFNDITYDSSVGSIEIPLLSVQPAVRQLQLPKTIKPMSLNFSSDSAEVDANANGSNGDVGSNLQPTNSSSNRTSTDNSGSSHPSSNDSAIEIDGHKQRRSPQPQPFEHPTMNAMKFGPMMDWRQPECIIYFKNNNNNNRAIIEQSQSNRLLIEHLQQNHQSSVVTHVNGNISTSTQGHMSEVLFIQRKKTLAARMLRFLGPCARCEDQNQSLDASNDATYTLMAYSPNNRSQNLR